MTTLRRLGAFLVLAAAGAVVGLPVEAQTCTNPVEKTVTVSVNASGDGLTLSDEHVRIRVNCDTVHWTSNDGAVHIFFKKNKHPFAQKPQHAADHKHVRTGKAKPGTEGPDPSHPKAYPYSVVLILPSGDPIVVDPDVEVIPLQ